MKLWLLLFVLSAAMLSYAKEDVKKFNKVLLENVNKDITNQNDDAFKTKSAKGPVRGPASVTPEWSTEPTPKIDKTVKQLGHSEW